ATRVLAGLEVRLRPPEPVEGTVEVGAIGGDLPFWRAKEALRQAELRLGAQAQATQALEGRATSMLGWNVTGGLALGAAIVGGSHPWAALTAALSLVGAGLLCVWALVRRDWHGVAGYDPRVLLEDRSGSEYEVVVGLAEGYQETIDANHLAFHRFKAKLTLAICLMVAAPVIGLVVLAAVPAHTRCGPPIIGVRAGLVCRGYSAALHPMARVPCNPPIRAATGCRTAAI
ncbi:MAG TPA: hypothetical protein VMB71_15590, partial [Acetobacteraceae bacterium]|nr:hypothetical protein [Acetobacteraceae bacterium]